MAQLISIRQRSWGAEISVLDDTDREHVFQKPDHPKGQLVRAAWWEPLLTAKLAAEAVDATAQADRLDQITTKSRWDALVLAARQNRQNEQVQAALLRLIRALKNLGAI